MKKKLFSMILLVVLFMLLPMSVSATEIVAGGIGSDNLTWKIDSEGVLTISGTGAMTDYEIIYDFEKSEIELDDRPWVDFCAEVKEVIIKDGVTSIGNYAFERCAFIEKIVMPDGLKSIGGRAFTLCQRLNGVVIPEGVITIGVNAFIGCESLTNIEIPKSIKNIGAGAFDVCDALTDVRYAGTKAEWDNISIGKDNECLTNAKNIHYVSEEKLENENVSSEEVLDSGTCGENLTWTYDSNNVLTISGTGAMADYICPLSISSMDDFDSKLSPWALYSIGIDKVLINDGVTSIGNHSFETCMNLTSVVIPEGVITIGDEAFMGCVSMTSIEIPKSTKNIGARAFAVCGSLTDVYYAGTKDEWNKISIGKENECLTNAKNIHYGNDEKSGNENVASVEVLDSGTCGENLTWTYDSNSVLTINGTGTMANYDFPLLYGNFESDLELVCPWYAYSAEIKDVVIKDGITSIGNHAFTACLTLKSVVIPEGVTTIGDKAFMACVLLPRIEIPKSIKTIGDGSFDTCRSLTDVYYAGTKDEWNKISIGKENECLTNAKYIHYGNGDVSKNEKISVNSGTFGENLKWTFDNKGVLTISGTGEMTNFEVDVYEELNLVYDTRPWLDFCDSISKVIIQDGVTSIGDKAFSICFNLTSVIIPEGVTSIGESAFSSCYKLTDVVLPQSVTTIGNGAFYSCESLTSIVIPDGVTTLNEGAFSDCYSLSNVVLPAGLATIGEKAFYACDSLTDVYYAGTKDEWNTISIGIDNDELISKVTYNLESSLGSPVSVGVLALVLGVAILLCRKIVTKKKA